MSGWIKFEKDLANDPRVIRMAKELAKTWFFVSSSNCLDGMMNARNADALPGVTLVLGALTRLWVYADSHCRDDNTLDLGAVEIDELLEIPNFCSLMPSDWLVEIDENTVELPGFQEHNGVEAKKKALTQKRVARHRDKLQRKGVTSSNARALPDQDQTKTREEALAEARAIPGLDVKAFDRFVTYRAERKPAIKTISLVAAATELAKFGPQQSDVVQNSVANGYQGFFAPKSAAKQAAPKKDPYANSI